MDKPSFTPEERQLMQRIIAAGDMRYLSFYASVLFAPTAFAIYGFMKQDASAISAAFLGLLLIFLWVIYYKSRDAKLLSSICARVLAADKGEHK